MFSLFAEDKDARIDAWLGEYLRTWFLQKPNDCEDLLHQAVMRWDPPEATEYFQEHWRIHPNPRNDS